MKFLPFSRAIAALYLVAFASVASAQVYNSNPNNGPMLNGMPATPTAPLGQYNSALPTFASGTFGSLQMDANGRLLVSVTGTFWQATQPVSIADGSDTTLGFKADAKSTATDTTAVSLMAVLKQVSASVQTLVSTGAPINGGTGTVFLAAGTTSSNAISATSAASGVSTVSRIVSAAASTNATSAKASAGRVYKITGYNAAAAVRYIKVYNKASAPTVGTDTPVITEALAPSSKFTIDVAADIGFYFSTGIAYALTTGSADADTGALTAADIVGLNVYYQ
jgi:hypothetical protein